MALYKDSVGNHYTTLPAKKAQSGARGAKPGPKHGRKSRYTGDKKKHGERTGTNGRAARVRYYGEPKTRERALGER